jgi:hypothetical protein
MTGGLLSSALNGSKHRSQIHVQDKGCNDGRSYKQSQAEATIQKRAHPRAASEGGSPQARRPCPLAGGAPHPAKVLTAKADDLPARQLI